MTKVDVITINDKPINIIQGVDQSKYISLTDMIKAYEPDLVRTDMIIGNWLRLKDTIDYLGIWEIINNPNFNPIEFDGIKTSAGTNRFILTAKEWVQKTGAIGLQARAGRYGGTFAHKDIAYNFGMWLNPAFYLLVVKEVQRLESEHNNPLLLQWDIKRILTKTNYSIHTDAIKNSIIPMLNIEKTREHVIYASEADLLNIILFGCTAKEWQDANPELAQKMNIRDTASINELLVLSNLESYNGELIRQVKSRSDRFELLLEMRNKQLDVLLQVNADFNFRKLTGNDPKQLSDGKETNHSNN